MSRLGHAFSSFLVVGAICTTLQYAILVVLVQTTGANATLASTIGFAASTVLNYALNYRFTYRATTPHATSFPRFIAVALAGLALNATIVYAGTEVAGVHYLLAQLAATGAVLFWNFFVNLKWSFSKTTG
jgi:putative flippase GtrA